MEGVKKFAKFIVVFAVIFSWVFGGWPRIWNFPPEIQEARAAGVTYVTNSSIAGKTTTCAITKPTGLAVNDLMIAHLAWEAEGTGISGPSGWVTVGSEDRVSAGVMRSKLMYKVAVQADVDATSFDFTSSTSAQYVCAISVFQGHNLTTPIDASNGQVNAASATITSAGVDPTITNAMIVFFTSTSDDNLVTDDSYNIVTSNPTWTERYDVKDLTGSDVDISMATATRPEDTATGNGTATSAASDINIGHLVAIKPAVAPTVTTQAATDKEATAATCNGTIAVTGGANATAVGCEWDTDSGAPYANNPSTAGDYGAAPFTQSLTGLPSGTTIYARAFAANSGGTGYGGEVNFLTKPAAPTSLNFTSVTATALRLNWTASTGAASYKVERCTGTGCSSYSEIAIGVTNVYYDDTGRTGNTVYRYQVRATNATGDSAYSSGSEQLMLPDVPGTPTFSDVTGTSITINWNAPTGGADSYKVERAPDSGGAPGSFTEVAAGVTSPWTNNTGLVCNTTYWYKVRGTNATGDGLYSANASQITGSCNTAPSFSVIPNDSPDPVVAGYDVTFSGTATDSESNSWYLAVCKTNSITAGSPPACDSGQTYCVSSSAVATGFQNTCIWISSGLGAQIWYAFACDNNASPLCSSNSNANSPVTVNAQSLTFSISANAIDFGALSAAAARFATTAAGSGGSATETAAHALSASTNASGGYIITVQGATLTHTSNGSFTISAITPSAVDVTLAGSKGTEQFGIRLSASGTGVVTSPYDGAANFYVYNGAAAVTSQVASGAGDGTTTVFSVRYAANISAVTEPGNYNTNLTYTASGNF